MKRLFLAHAIFLPATTAILILDVHFHVRLWVTVLCAVSAGFQLGLFVWAIAIWRNNRWLNQELKRLALERQRFP